MLQNLKTPSKCEKSHIACLVSSLRPFPLLFKCRRLLLFNKFLQKCLLYRVGLEHWKICLHGQCFYNSVITAYLSQSEHGKHTWASQSAPSSSFFPPLSLLFLSFPPSSSFFPPLPPEPPPLSSLHSLFSFFPLLHHRPTLASASF